MSNDNVPGWQFFAYGYDYVKPDTVNNMNTFGLKFDPLEHYYAFVAGGALASFGNQVPLTLTVNDASISAVPIPAAVWLFGSGIVGLIGASRRKMA